MQTLEPLPLFNQQDLKFNILNVPQNDEKETSFESPITENQPREFLPEPKSAKIESTTTLINYFFPDYKSEKDIANMRKIIDALLDENTEEELHSVLTEIQFISDFVLEEYEKMVFKGKTLNELLNSST